MARIDISRRDLLSGVGAAGLGTLPLTRRAGAAERTEYNVGTASPAAERAARDAAGTVVRVLDWGDGEKTVTATFAEQAVENLENRPDVRYTERNGEMEAIAQTVPWGVDRVDADVVHADGETGGDDTDGEGGGDIAIIDTGIDSDHPDLEANLGTGTAFVDARGPYAEPWDDDNGHGTHCAGIADAVDDGDGVVGVGTAATLHAVKVLDKNGSGSYSDVAAGIEWVADRGYDVGSLSLGGGKSLAVADACEYAAGEGVLLVAAAGNAGPCTDCVGYPAAEPAVVAVSATDPDDSLASYSSTGPEVELAAPGTDVYSTYAGGGYATLSGTSMACPHVSGAGVQLMDNGYTSTEARDRLASTAEDVGLSDDEGGNGLLDVAAAMDGSTDATPNVSWVNPGDGETVSGTVTVRIDAADREDGDDALDVTYEVDGGAARSTTYDSESGYYEDAWDTTALTDGDHDLTATATDSAGNTGNATVTVATDNTDDTTDTGSAPAIDTFEPTDDGNPAWTRYYVDWGVSDADGDLSSVTTELLDSGGTLDSDASSVDGADATGTHYVETKGSATRLRLTVTDDAGNRASSTREI